MRVLALGVLLLVGCAGKGAGPKKHPVVVTQLAVEFPDRDRGELAFTLRLPPDAPVPTEIAWELFLDGSRFAAGLEGEVKPVDGLYPVRSALVSRHLGWREGEAFLDVVLQGEVDLGTGTQRLGFRDRREVQVQGRPQLNIPRD